MFNISEHTIIYGFENTGITKGHLQQCLMDKNLHEKPVFSYFGKTIFRGTIIIHSCKGDFNLLFCSENGWLKVISIK